jgi:hypothetical protein
MLATKLHTPENNPKENIRQDREWAYNVRVATTKEGNVAILVTNVTMLNMKTILRD